MKKHFVNFCSPGTFLTETSTLEISDWDINKAVEMSYGITERYNSTPYGFYFSTKERTDDELDSKVVETSNMYYLGGDVFTLEDIKAKNDPNDEILIWNMETNNYEKVIINTNSWKFTTFLKDDDVVLEYVKKVYYKDKDNAK